MIIFQALGDSLVLPNPDFGDSIQPNHIITSMRTFTNKQYTYIATNSDRTLNFQFSIDSCTYGNALTFILEHNSDLLILTNYNGDIYKGYLTTNPTSFTRQARWAPCGEQVTVGLEFRGAKLN